MNWEFSPEALVGQISWAVKADIGWREPMHSTTGSIAFDFPYVQAWVGNRRSKRKVLIHYDTTMDLYHIVVGRVKKIDWVEEARQEHVYAENLNVTLINLVNSVL